MDNIEAIAKDIVDAAYKVHKEFRNCKLGFLINWNVKLIKNGITRVANGMAERSLPVKFLKKT